MLLNKPAFISRKITIVNSMFVTAPVSIPRKSPNVPAVVSLDVASGVMQAKAGVKIGSGVEVKYATGGAAAVVDTSVDWTGLPIQASRFLKGLRLIAFTS